MKAKASLLLVAPLALFLTGLDASIGDASQNAAAVRAGAKLQYIEKNAGLARPDRTPTELTDDEINAYFASGKVKLPVGVQSVRFQGQRGIVTASCRVDFDQVKAGRHTANPLLSLFSGLHDVVVVANASGAAGQGLVDVQSVSLDGVEVPSLVLEIFVEKYLTPKYPHVGLQSRFALPAKVDTAVVGEHTLTVAQK